MAHQFLAGQQQKLGLLFQLFAVPALAAESAAHIGGQLLVVKGVNQLLVHQHILAARLVFQLFHLLDELEVGRQKGQRTFPLAGHQRLADKHLARTGQVDPPVVHPPPAVNHDAVERGALQRHHFGSLLFPMRIEQLLFQQMPAHLLNPLRIDMGKTPAEQPRGFHQLRRHDPAPRLLGQVRARVGKKLDAARAQVFALLPFVFHLAADIAQQAREHGHVQLLV